ncbi:MAG: DUF5058 family protein [Clostridiaceae bacterium]|nr:DUF5058 family protein [Clostridiaceae bacterium]
MNYLQIANSPILWVACAIPVALVIFQSLLFMRKAYSTGLQIGMTRERMNYALKSGLITAIGPSLVILVGMIVLIATLGGPISWMRLSYVGAVMFESMAASYGTQAMGITLGSDAMNGAALANAVWAMVAGSIGWIIVGGLLPKRMHKLENKLAKKDNIIVKVIAGVAIFGAFGGFLPSYILGMNKSTLAVILGAVIMLVCMILEEKAHWKFMKEWALAISLFGGMLLTTLF